MFVAYRTLGTKRIYWSIPFFLAALFTKQDYISAPVAVIVYLFFKDRTRCYKFIGCMTVGGLILVGICTLVFGKSFIYQTFLVGSQPFSVSSGTLLLKIVFTSALAIIGLALGYIVYTIKRKELNLFCIYFVFTTILCFILISKKGAWLNYSIEAVAVGAILSGMLMGAVLKKSTVKTKWQFIVLACLVLFPIGAMRSGYGLDLRQVEIADRITVTSILKNVSDPVICEDATILMEANKQVIWEPSVFVLGGYYKSKWSQTPFVNELKSEKFNLIVLNYNLSTWWLPQDDLPYPHPHERLTEEMATAIVNNYHLTYNGSGYWIYAPNR